MNNAMPSFRPAPDSECEPSVPGGIGRREFLRQGAVAGVGIGTALLAGSGCGMLREQARRVTGPEPAAFAPLPHTADTTPLHVLNRVAFGPRPGDVARVVQTGAAGYIEEQLADRMDEDPVVGWRVNGLETQEDTQNAPDALYNVDDGQIMTEMQQAALLRAVYSRHQLRETLADFWINHFNIYALKNDGRNRLPPDTETVIRPHVLGTFREMLLASAHSPAMLGYLDNQENRRGVANENYARELLELHTLGVNSGYTQRDIQEVARCFTGWTVKTGFQRGQFVYDETRHDDRAKFIPFLNLTVAPGGGQHDAEMVLETLAVHPVTARFIARKLCRRYLGHTPDAIVEKAANAYVRSKSDIRATLRPILLDALLSPDQHKPIFKRPLEYLVSSLRALSADTDGGSNLQKHLADMGQPLYQWPTPDGYPEKASAWTGSMLPRWNFALALAGNAIGGTIVDLSAFLAALPSASDEAELNALVETIIARPHDTPEVAPLREKLRLHLADARRSGLPDAMLRTETAGLLLASPPFQWR